MDRESIGVTLAVLTAIISGISIPANKIFVVNMDPAVFTALRLLIIGTVFLFVSLWLKKKTKRKKFVVSWKYMAAIAVIGGAAAFLLYFSGLKLTTATHAAFLHKTLPLYVAVLAFIFLKERITKKYFIAIGFMVLGTIAVYAMQLNPTELWSNPQLGDLLVIGATILWAIENVIAKKAMNKGDDNFIVAFNRMFFGGLILLGFVLLTGKVDAIFALTVQQWTNVLISSLLLFGYVLFFYWSLKFINVSKAVTYLLVAPIITLIVGVTFFREPMPATQIAGSAMILIGAYLITGIKSEERGV